MKQIWSKSPREAKNVRLQYLQYLQYLVCWPVFHSICQYLPVFVGNSSKIQTSTTKRTRLSHTQRQEWGVEAVHTKSKHSSSFGGLMRGGTDGTDVGTLDTISRTTAGGVCKFWQTGGAAAAAAVRSTHGASTAASSRRSTPPCTSSAMSQHISCGSGSDSPRMGHGRMRMGLRGSPTPPRPLPSLVPSHLVARTCLQYSPVSASICQYRLGSVPVLPVSMAFKSLGSFGLHNTFGPFPPSPCQFGFLTGHASTPRCGVARILSSRLPKSGLAYHARNLSGASRSSSLKPPWLTDGR